MTGNPQTYIYRIILELLTIKLYKGNAVLAQFPNTVFIYIYNLVVMDVTLIWSDTLNFIRSNKTLLDFFCGV